MQTKWRWTDSTTILDVASARNAEPCRMADCSCAQPAHALSTRGARTLQYRSVLRVCTARAKVLLCTVAAHHFPRSCSAPRYGTVQDRPAPLLNSSFPHLIPPVDSRCLMSYVHTLRRSRGAGGAVDRAVRQGRRGGGSGSGGRQRQRCRRGVDERWRWRRWWGRRQRFPNLLGRDLGVQAPGRGLRLAGACCYPMRLGVVGGRHAIFRSSATCCLEALSSCLGVSGCPAGRKRRVEAGDVSTGMSAHSLLVLGTAALARWGQRRIL